MQTLDEKKVQLLEEMYHLTSYPIVSNECGSLVSDCLQVVGPHFCMVSRNGFEIYISLQQYAQACKEILSANEKNIHDKYCIIRALKDEMGIAQTQCNAIVSSYRIKLEAEKKALEERLDLEEDIRSRYRRR